MYVGKNSARELVAEEDSGTSEFTVPVRARTYSSGFPQGIKLDAPEYCIPCMRNPMPKRSIRPCLS